MSEILELIGVLIAKFLRFLLEIADFTQFLSLPSDSKNYRYVIYFIVILAFVSSVFVVIGG